MNLNKLKKHWNTYSKVDPLWAVLTDSSKKDGKWDVNEFFQTGITHIAGIFQYLESIKVQIQHKRALDFGCGVGRLTQALCKLFDECVGIDIAPGMIKLAKKFNRFGDRCKYYVNDKSDLSIFPADSIDFIYTWLVLQHIEPRYVKEYLKEFLRIISPGGVIIFQLPSERIDQKSIKDQAIAVSHYTLPSSGFKALLTTVEPLQSFYSGRTATVKVSVKNISDAVWPSSSKTGIYQINLGNHWLDKNHHIILLDDGRIPLPHDVKPSEEIELELEIRVPLQDGLYILELDMVQEHIAWFHDRGSATLSVPVQVRKDQFKSPISTENTNAEICDRKADNKQDHDDVALPVMEMHGIPQNDVIRFIEKNRGKIINIQEDFTAGADWESYRYCITK
jgi:ubiquinone/menaquinone biosynthesis C-methylase UbiE